MTSPLPNQIGRYRIERELGRGAMGVVYEAEDTALGRKVALKTFAAMDALAPKERESFEKRFLSEARISATIEDEHVVGVYDVGRDPESGLLFMALEYVKGETLAGALERGPMPWRRAVRLIAKVARALHTAHAQHIVHRDIKPANIMLNTAGVPKLMDFGIAKASASQMTLAGQVFGTPAYMSPEQASGEEVDGRSDVFSLGVVLYELLTNTRAFEGSNVAATLSRILREEPRPPSGLVEIPKALDAIVARALKKSRDARYETAAQLAADLEDVLEGKDPTNPAMGDPLATLPLSAVPRPQAPPETRVMPVAESPIPGRASRTSPGRKRILLAGGIGVVVFLAGLFAFRSSRPQETTATTVTPGEIQSWSDLAREAGKRGDSASASSALRRIRDHDPKNPVTSKLVADLNGIFAPYAFAAQAEMEDARKMAEVDKSIAREPAFVEAEALSREALENMGAGEFTYATQGFIDAGDAYDRARRSWESQHAPDEATANPPGSGRTDGEGATSLSVSGASEPAKVSLELRHPFASGSLRIRMDGAVVFAESISGMPVTTAGTTSYDGRFATALTLPAGDHLITVEVRSGTSQFVESTRMRLEPGESRRLYALVDKNLHLTVE